MRSARVLADALASPATWLRRAMAAPLLPHAIAAPRRILGARVGRISYYEDGAASGPPVVLIHDLGPAGCAYEVRALFDALRGERPVVAVDLPGYGFSDRRDAPLTRDEHVDFVEDLVTDISRRYGAAVDVVAIGVSGELAARAVLGSPRAVRSLAIVAPTGIGSRAGAFAGAVERGARALAAVVRAPGVGAVVHRALTTRPVLRVMLGPACDARLVAYASAAAHQPRARHGALAAIVGDLRDGSVATEVYGRLTVPTCLVHGQAHARSIEALAASRGAVRSARVSGARARPHVEQPRDTAEALRSFWGTLGRRPELRLIRGAATAPDGEVARPRTAPRLKRARPGREGKPWM